eukprot:769629-Amphidinium_carterae.1
MHLNHNLRCALYTMMNCDQLSDVELRAARAVKAVLRTAPPKRGPKQVVEGSMPRSRTIRLLDLNVTDEHSDE